MFGHVADKSQSAVPDIFIGGVLEISWEMWYDFKLLDLACVLLAFFNHQTQHMQHLHNYLAVFFYVE